MAEQDKNSEPKNEPKKDISREDMEEIKNRTIDLLKEPGITADKALSLLNKVATEIPVKVMINPQSFSFASVLLMTEIEVGKKEFDEIVVFIPKRNTVYII